MNKNQDFWATSSSCSDPIPHEWDTTFRYFFDNQPENIKYGEKTVDALNIPEAEAKIMNMWPNAHDIRVDMRKSQ